MPALLRGHCCRWVVPSRDCTCRVCIHSFPQPSTRAPSTHLTRRNVYAQREQRQRIVRGSGHVGAASGFHCQEGDIPPNTSSQVPVKIVRALRRGGEGSERSRSRFVRMGPAWHGCAPSPPSRYTHLHISTTPPPHPLLPLSPSPRPHRPRRSSHRVPRQVVRSPASSRRSDRVGTSAQQVLGDTTPS